MSLSPSISNAVKVIGVLVSSKVVIDWELALGVSFVAITSILTEAVLLIALASLARNENASFPL